jgi:hypothetical protein
MYSTTSTRFHENAGNIFSIADYFHTLIAQYSVNGKRTPATTRARPPPALCSWSRIHGDEVCTFCLRWHLALGQQGLSDDRNKDKRRGTAGAYRRRELIGASGGSGKSSRQATGSVQPPRSGQGGRGATCKSPTVGRNGGKRGEDRDRVRH